MPLTICGLVGVGTWLVSHRHIILSQRADEWVEAHTGLLASTKFLLYLSM